MAKQTMKERVEASHQRLVDGVKQIKDGGQWTEMLKFSNRFHNYSPRNRMLISMDKPEATYVAGYHAWEEMGGQVKKGEKGIPIFVPMGKWSREAENKDDDSDTHKTVSSGTRFGIGHVFDISQVDGVELPELVRNYEEDIGVDAPQYLWETLEEFVTNSGFTIERDECSGGAQAYCNFKTKTIRVRPDVSTGQASQYLAHEVGHMLLHGDEGKVRSDMISGHMECEAESFAFLMSDAVGLPGEVKHFGYILSWSKGDPELVTQVAMRVMGAATPVLQRIDERVIELQDAQDDDHTDELDAPVLERV